MTMRKTPSTVRERYAGAGDSDDLPTALPWLGLVRRRAPTPIGRGMLEPSMCLMLQGEKQMLEARKLLMGGGIEASNVAFQVGYESPSQFSREYRRLFGASPIQDAEQLRGVIPSP